MDFSGGVNKIKEEITSFFKKYWFGVVISIILFYGFIFRLEGFIIRENWIDEIALACNFVENNGFLWIFKPLNHDQIAPPLFLAAAKIFTTIFKGAEWSYRIIPALSAMASIPVFYFVSKKFLSARHSIIFANFLYAVNFALIRYATEFKQYQTDILIFMVLLLYLSNKNLQNIDFKGGVKYSIIFTIAFFVSQPTIFLVFGFVLYNVILKIKTDGIKDIKNLLKICAVPVIPLIFVLLYKYLTPKDLTDFMNDWWDDGFITFKNFFHIIVENTNFFFYNIKCFYMLAPFIFAGFFVYIFKRNKTTDIFMLSLFGVFLAGMLKFYPYLHRLILFLFPFFILFICKIFDYFKFKNKGLNKVFTIGIIAFSFLFLNLYLNYVICKNRNITFVGISRARTATLILNELHKKGEPVFVPESNRIFYAFYDDCIGLKFKEETIWLDEMTEESLSKIANTIDKNKLYWVYIPSYSKDRPGVDYFENWIEKTGRIVLYRIKFRRASYIYKVKFL